MSEKRRVMLRVAYDGTAYCGWQYQPGMPTIEGALCGALRRLLREDVRIVGASRTDAGVHAMGNVAVFDTSARIPAERISYALNRFLPGDIAVQESREVPRDFHPRHCHSKKTYEYRILNREFPLPALRRDTYFFHRPLDAGRMGAAAAYLAGTHDFASFCSIHTQALSTVREIYSCTAEREGDIVIVRVTGAGFLYNMVRIIAGTLIEAGYGARDPEGMPAILDARDRAAAGPTAPAHGLTLIGIEFAPGDLELTVDKPAIK